MAEQSKNFTNFLIYDFRLSDSRSLANAFLINILTSHRKTKK